MKAERIHGVWYIDAMKPHPPPHRIRKTIKWGGAVVTVLLVVVWIGSGWWWVHWGSGKANEFNVRCGTVNIVYEIGRPTAHTSSPGWRVGRPNAQVPFTIYWGFSREIHWYDLPIPQQPPQAIDPTVLLGLPGSAPRRNTPAASTPLQRTYEYEFEVAIWPLPAAALFFTAFLWYLDTLARRRARLNLCPKCHYDRTGLAAGAKCPECGAVHAAPVLDHQPGSRV